MPRLSKILGPDGSPVDLDALFGPPKAGPSLTSVRSPISGHPAEGLTPARLAAIHRAAANGDPLLYLELAEDIEERDLHYAAVLGTRRRQVAQLPVTVEAASDAAEHVAHADLIRDWLKEGVLDAALFDMLDAIGKGYSILEIEWDSTPGAVLPRRLDFRPQRWFELDQVDYETPMLREATGLEPLAPHKFVVHRHPSKSGLTIRSGIARVASWAWMYKAFTLRDWAIFVQNYGMPVRLGKYHPAASEQEKDVLWRAVANIAGDCAAIIPQGMEIDFVEAARAKQGSAGELYSDRADWFDQQVSKAVLGQTATTDAIAGGHAVGQEHRLVQEDLERSDAKLLAATLTRQLVPHLIAFNFGPQKRYPKILIGRPDEVPIEIIVNALDKLGPQGLTVEVSQMRDRLGFEEPAAGAEVIGGRPPAPAPSSPGRARPGDPSLPTEGPVDPGRDGSPSLNAARLIVSRHAVQADPEHVERLTERVARDAAGAMAGLTDEVAAAFDAATDLRDLADRLAALQLDPTALAEAMTRGMALAHLAGQAALLDEIEGE
ncbi:DUF935 domain-containing protein [Rhodoplanes sp. TEM]|uniref:DUF935 domain-containing protein n=1 Tax=Rhodoplanes tepidamans TaxID=200616 RepID=A0ABT5JE67_RHOTP|nr:MULTISPECIES: DUF935 domain-containing protein [Rhodoplanes]MDC7787980.1 DUF935 domain-containing protein [Rhodoplanes tepidamans]MDC7984820.1 DUF935 domain-containing protein [Rhodoplanes sp. TEM]MDQ0358409.1 phage gp29-like protein [Rhodoplanes tepidamans]